jgi:hypothetical protein
MFSQIHPAALTVDAVSSIPEADYAARSPAAASCPCVTVLGQALPRCSTWSGSFAVTADPLSDQVIIIHACIAPPAVPSSLLWAAGWQRR